MASTPDPSTVRDVAGFVHALRLLKVWAGDPSFDQLARRSGLPRSTLADAVKQNRERLPQLDVVRSFVRACGQDDPSSWDDAWRRVQSARVPSPDRVLPRELPPDVMGFSGRADVLDALDAITSTKSTPPLIAICGTAGVGKTAVAVHWAH
ncbi:MAG TPA: helix-turn-helix transcriptional regulator [Jatrophihabitantaceae bacterium]|nr:helix-turn-helix transcriptional regulator [Jatrophihabitantaceae bacterium]